ncbi:hypothetical protein [Streptomyces sp. BE133]|uniref:hypothetical protein n=1 Tax=Streptomyces sp. BE133 TaxID=3002523 RepID=UPI002E774789|nr:hypothetical protein [Streptomyces sp. BE133]MEE1805406.1 hypothetical protein [Streptomyces sp. BE133]
MSPRVDNLPTETQVRAALSDLLQQADDNGARPSVLALARRFSMSNTTFRRHFPELATEISTIRSTPSDASPTGEPNRYDKLVARNAKLKRRNRELTDYLALAAAHVQKITLENQRLRQGLEAAAGLTRLTDRIPSRRALQ